MDLKIQAKAAERIFHIATKTAIEQTVPFIPRKVQFPRGTVLVEKPLPRCAPEDVGVNSKLITAFLKDLEGDQKLNVHQVMVVKNGRIISEAAFAPYKLEMWHVTHSACKTVTALAVGILVKDGMLKLSDRIVRIFDEECPPLAKLKLAKLNVEHLLTMTSGIVMNELVVVDEKDWLKAFFESSLRFEPGTKFHYNSLNSYVLSCIVEKITGVTLFDFLQEKLFEPLGIKTVMWESCPMGRTKGGWGMYLLPEDMAKLALFVMNGAEIDGRPVISAEYLKSMTTKRIDTDEDDHLYGYGYQAWMGKHKDSWFFSGMLGQNICCMPAADTVIITTGGSDRLFGNGPINDLINKYFAPDYQVRYPASAHSRQALRELRTTEKHLENKRYSVSPATISETLKRLASRLDSTVMPKDAKALVGRSWVFDRHFVRLQPLFSQILNNSYSYGIDRIGFSEESERLIMTVSEGKQKNKIPLSFGSWIYSRLNFSGEPYEVAVTARFTHDEDDNLVLKIMLPFIEHSDGRVIKLHFMPDKTVTARFFEYPGAGILGDGLGFALDTIGDSIAGPLTTKIDKDLILDLSSSAFEPVVIGKPEKSS